MSQEFLAAGGLILFVMGLIWLALNQWLIQRLRNYHASTYEALGSPRLFANNSPRNSRRGFTFLVRSQFKLPDDPALNIVCRIMQAYACVFIIVFLFFFAAMLFTPPTKPTGR
jgi:hypothetical protein